MNQPQVCVPPLTAELPSHLPPHPTPKLSQSPSLSSRSHIVNTPWLPSLHILVCVFHASPPRVHKPALQVCVPISSHLKTACGPASPGHVHTLRQGHSLHPLASAATPTARLGSALDADVRCHSQPAAGARPFQPRSALRNCVARAREDNPGQ